MAKTVTAEELATNLDGVIEELQKTGEEVVISKNGWPMAKMVPATTQFPRTLESLRESGSILGDIEESTADEWGKER